MNNNPTKKPFVFPNPFTRFCQSIGAIPTSYQDSLDYYETLLWLIKFLENTVIPAVNTNSEAVTELQGFYLQLQSYVNNYFDNLDVQEEINNKLDAMVEDGTLESILLNYTQISKVYNTYQELINDTTITNGMKLKTLGYYNINDGGGADYIATSTLNQNKFVDEINGLYIEMIVKDYVIPNQLGAYGDGIHDDSVAIQKSLSKSYQVKFNKQTYLIGNTITIGPNKIIDFNWATLITSNNVTAFTINKNNGENIYTYITLKNAFVNMENGGNFIEDVNCYNITYDNIRINRLHGSNFGFKITNGFNHRFLNVWINGMSDSEETISGNYANGIIYDIDGNTTIQGITNVTNTTFIDCVIQGLYNGIRFDRSGNSGSYDTTFMENMGFSSCDKCINVNTPVLNDVNIQTIRCEWSDYALYIKENSSFIINNFFSNGTNKSIYNNGNIIFGGNARFDSQTKPNCYIIDYNNGKLSFENCINFSNIGMIEFNPNITSQRIKQMDGVKELTNNSQSIILSTFVKNHYKQTNYLNFTNITNLHDGIEFTLTNARDSGSVTLPDETSLQVGETVKCYVINNSIKYIKLT